MRSMAMPFPTTLHTLFRDLARRVRPDARALEGARAREAALARRVAELERENAMLLERAERAERALELGEATARRSAAILGSISDAFFALDDQWRLEYINSQAEALFTTRRDEVLGRPVWRAFRLTGTALERALHEAVRTRDVVRLEETQRGGSYAVAVYPFATGVSVFLSDVTRSRLPERRLRA